MGLSKITGGIKKGFQFVTNTLKEGRKPYQPIYRVLSIEQNEDEDYFAIIQVINKSYTFKMKPEEILADDRMTNSFAPMDIRTLTYLGYLGINSPKYQILAERLSEQDNGLIFAIKEKGKKKALIKTAEEIATDEAILSKLSQKDAHRIGYTAAAQLAQKEKLLKEQLLNQRKARNDNGSDGNSVKK